MGRSQLPLCPVCSKPSTGHKMRAKYQQMDPWTSAFPPSSLVFMALAHPKEPRSLSAGLALRLHPGSSGCQGSRGKDAANPWPSGVFSRRWSQCSFTEDSAYPWLLTSKKLGIAGYKPPLSSSPSAPTPPQLRILSQGWARRQVLASCVNSDQRPISPCLVSP